MLEEPAHAHDDGLEGRAVIVGDDGLEGLPNSVTSF